ncbi:GntR family transcriptional regulator [Paenalcaligenes suwonensis]|uniref:GntR family transcriptional regulator n=1 Tax=Paenalcaligenes suwonensis TaxID=1202713 RepID=UPI00140DE6BE|nr:GntR family transcriptional regulator [Paenalcaligenes suwonensis]NHC62338.1 GntR family transcriptional regulator [Paenalcaligenes suwonensis]
MDTFASAVPLYEKIFALIKANIETGLWQPGEKMPSERELCERYDVSRITVRRAVEMAEQAQLIKRVRGSGTYVMDKKYNQALKKVVSFEKTLSALGATGSTRIHRIERTTAGLLMESMLHTGPDEAVLNVQLIGEANGTPIVFYDSYFAENIGETIVALAKQAEKEKRAFSTVELQHIRLHQQSLRIKQTFEAIVADQEMSALLEVETGHPVLKITSILYHSEQAIEYRLAYYLGDKYKFSTERTVYSSFT